MLTIPRRRAILGGICGILPLLTVSAAGVRATVPPPPLAAATAASAYKEGAALVTRGRRLETAIARISDAVRLAPENGEYHLTLGCALARRAVVVSWASRAAMAYEAAKPKYAARFAVWEKAQTDKANPLFGAPPPPLPVPPTTMDDNKPFTLTPEQAKDRASDLCRRALAEWDTALALTGEATEAERANGHFVRGWGRIVVRRIGNAAIDPKIVPDQKQVVEDFEAALALAPENPRYWQSLGDAYISDPSPKLWQRDKAIAAYRKALTLDGRSPTLWHLLYTLQEKDDPDAAAAALEKAVAVDSSNAYYWYLLANLHLKKYAGRDDAEKLVDAPQVAAVADEKPAETRDPAALAAGLSAVERGNSGTFRPAAYQYAIPTLLAPLNPRDGEVSDALYGVYILILPQNLALAVKTSLAANDTASGVATARTGVRFGERMLELAQTQSNPGNEFLAWSFCMTPVHSGYSSLADALAQAGDATGAARARAGMAERDALVRKNALRTQEMWKQYYR